MQPTLTIALSLAILSLLACPTHAELQPPKSSTNVPTLVTGGNAFAFDLYSALRSQPGNLFFSPHSIHAALGMTYAGARGRTAEQMAAVLHFNLPQGALHPAYATLLHDLNADATRDGRELYRLIVANALWAQEGYPFHRDFQQLVETHYNASIRPLDFAHDAESARDQINRWAAQQTRDRIKDLIPPNILTPATRLVLTNAIYFKSSWAQCFDKSDTQDEPFHLSPDQSIKVPMMYQKERLSYLETDQLQAVELPYVGRRLSMLLLLPKKVDGLPELEKDLTSANLAHWLQAMSMRQVRLSLPRFKITSQFNLSSTLRAMGMPDAFAPNAADFSAIATAERLFLQAVLHKAFVDVNEEGTEAAAATATAVGALSMANPQEPAVFRADHPFLFLIRHRSSGQILFLGRLSNPRN
ncbi:MAG: serpin family protein [Bacillota bacterium]